MDSFDSTFLEKIFSKSEEKTEECSVTAGAFPAEMPVAMAYVPFQMWSKVYENETALARGTIFPSLDKPFIGEEAVRRVEIDK